MTWPAWLTAGVLAVLLFLAPIIIGLAVQRWYPWWVQDGLQGGVGSAALSNAPSSAAPVGPVPDVQAPVSDDVVPNAAAATSLSALLRQFMQPWFGTVYDFGGRTLRGVDCSCFTQHIYAAMGINLPRTAQTQGATARVSESAGRRSGLLQGDVRLARLHHPCRDLHGQRSHDQRR